MNKSPETKGELLTKEDFATGRHVEQLKRAGLLDQIELHPESYRIAKMHEMIDGAPGETVWLFGYGSLIWNPAFEYDEVRTGLLHGYHRSYCFWSTVGRGTPERPGMMLGLDRGGSCRGLVFGVRRHRASQELVSVFMRELTGSAYHARSLAVSTDAGRIKAIAFVVDPECRQYAGRIAPELVARHLAQAAGHLGSCSDYLLNTQKHLEAWGIHDRYLEWLCRRVEEIQAETSIPVTCGRSGSPEASGPAS